MAKRTCPNGHVTKDDKALKCSMCGADLPPVPKKNRLPLIIGIVVVLFLCIVGALASGGGDEGDKTAVSSSGNEQGSTAGEKPSATPKPSPTPKPIADLDFFEIRDQNSKLTEAQWEAYIKPLIGQRVRWTGYVTEVEDKGSKGYLWLDMDPPGSLSVQDLYLDIPKEDILKYNKDQKITFEGDLERIGTFLGSMQITFKDAVIVAAE